MLTGRILDPEEDKKQDIFDRTMKVETVDYIVDEKKRTATLTEQGTKKAEQYCREIGRASCRERV